MIRSDEALVLKTYDYRETSKICVFFTKAMGKMKGVLKGIRRDHKKFGSNVDIFSLNDIVFYWHPDSEMHLVGQCDLTDYYFPVRQDIRRMMAASYMTELVDKLMPLEEPGPTVYRLLLRYLESLKTVSDVDKLVHILQVKVLQESGFKPHLDSCVQCGRRIRYRARFSLQSGGLLCETCKPRDSSSEKISPGAVASILHIERNGWEKCLRLGLTPTVKKELKYVLNNFLVYHLERPLKSAKYL